MLKRFYLRLSAVFLVLLLVLAAIFILVTIRTFEEHQVEIDQRVNAGLAADMAREIEPQLDRGADSREIGSVIHYMMVLNPAVEIYLLDGRGRILAFFAEGEGEIQQDRIDLEPIREFLSPERSFPIFGDDPRRPQEKKHFSVAPITLRSGEEGYLYIVLQSSRYDRARQNLGDLYLLQAIRNSLIIALPSVAILGVVVFFLATRRLMRLTQTVSTFAEGEYGVRANAAAQDEIGELARTFNNMADTIEASHAQLLEADRQRRDLVASVSHDLRNPLASIRGYTETLLQKNDTLSAQERRRYLEVSLDRAAALSRLVGDLFELSTLEARDAEPQREQFSLSELAHDVVLQMQPRAEEREIALEIRKPESLHLVNGDVGKIERAVTNLIDNAIKFSPAGSAVTIALAARDDDVELSVEDAGPGIDHADREHLFDQFFTGDRSRSGSDKGSGLGLAIAKKIVELHGGSIDVDNADSGGSRFYFVLPAE